MTGWVSIQRNIQEHPFLKQEGIKRSRAEAWTWLIMNAAWADTQHRVGNQMRDVPRGSMFVTFKQMSEAWGWSKSAVSDFLKGLKSQNMISYESGTQKTFITLCNYNTFQPSQNANRTQTERKPDTKETNKQINNTTLHSGELDLISLEDDLREASKLHNSISPSLLVLSEPIRWLDAGCDLSMDIIPTLKAKTHSKVNSWAYFSNAVFEARDKRLAPSPDVVRPDFQNKKQQSGTDMLRAHANGEIL